MDAAAQPFRIGLLAIAVGLGFGINAVLPGVAAADTGAAGDPGAHPDSPRRGPTANATSTRAPGRAGSPGRALQARAGSPPLPAATAAKPSLRAAARPARVTSINALINNTSPQLTATQLAQSPAGVVSGTLSVADPDSSVVGVAVTRAPVHGTVTAGGGRYTYTADPTLAHTGYTDSFAVTVDDSGSGFHVHGLDGLVNLMTFGLFGISGHSTTRQVSVTVAPFNNPPTATVRTGSPAPVTGIVTGVVSGTDPNGDTLTYSGSGTTAKGAVIVSATGEFAYTPTSQALAGAASPAAIASDRQDTLTVTVDDGHGGVIAVPITVPVGLVTPTAPMSTFCGCTLMPAGTVFHADVSTLPVLAKSDTWTALIGGSLKAAWGGDPWMNSTAGMPVNIAGASLPTETVVFNRGLTTSGPSIDNRPYAIPDRPLVEGMPNVPAWDRHLLVLREGSCTSEELYNVANGVELPAAGIGDGLANAAYAGQYGSAWIAEAGVQVDMNSPLYPAQGWANASRLPYLPLILRPDDLARGSIDHMLGITIAKDRGTGYAWPARAGDGTGTNPDGVPMGTVLRLSRDFDISGYSSATQVVLRALQQHGAVIYDSSNAGQDGATLLAMSNGWTGTDYQTAQRELRTVPLSAFEAVDVLSLAADPATGWTIRV